MNVQSHMFPDIKKCIIHLHKIFSPHASYLNNKDMSERQDAASAEGKINC